MKLRAEEQAHERQREKAQMQVDAVARMGDAMIEAKKTPQEALIEEQKAIDELRKKGLIDEQTAKKAMADAELRAMQRDLDKGVEAMRERLGLNQKNDPNIPDIQGTRQPLSSVATTSAYALMAQGRGGGSDPVVAAMNRIQDREDKRQARWEAKQIENHREQIQALRAIGLWHS